MDKVKITFEYNGHLLTLDYGFEAYILHTGIYNELDKKYGFEALMRYKLIATECYLSDINRTPLGSLLDFIANNWESLLELDRYTILEKFYEGEY